MKRLKLIGRFITIIFVLSRLGIGNTLLTLPLPRVLRIWIKLNPWHWSSHKRHARGKAIRLSLEALGPIFVKFGQALSVRRDLLPKDIVQELSYLQDRVPPFESTLAIAAIEKALGQPINILFDDFESKALASASIAQVHGAKLKDGTNVVVKILRPKIKQIIARDIELLRVLAKRADRIWPRLRPSAIVNEFSRTLDNELNLAREAANGSHLRRNLQDSDNVYVPKIHWPLTNQQVMVSERIYGIPISDIQTLKAHNVNLQKLAEIGVETFFTQVFRDAFFHADMHPGNIFVDISDPESPRYIAVDFGIMGTLNANDQRYLALNFLAFFNRDYRKVAQLHRECGWVPRGVDVLELETAIRTVCEPIFERPLKDISCAHMLVSLFQVGKDFQMEVQPQLLLLQKTLFAIEGLGRELYPELNLWESAKPHLKKWLKAQTRPKRFAESMMETLPALLEQFPQMPGLLYDALTALKEKRDDPMEQKLNGVSSGGYLSVGIFLATLCLSIIIFY